MSYRVILMPRADCDLQEATDWLLERAPLGAVRWLDGFWKSVKELEVSPERWPLAPESHLTTRAVREHHYQTKSSTTRVLFVIVDDEVRVLRIRRPGQDLLRAEDLH